MADPASLQFAAPVPRKVEPATVSTAAIPITARQAKPRVLTSASSLTCTRAARDGRAMTKTALVAGAGGAASKRLIEVLLADPDWSVIALARTPRASSGRLTAISRRSARSRGLRRGAGRAIAA